MNNNNPGSFNETNSRNNPIPWGTKAKYIGTGIVVGIVIGPLFRRALSKLQPQVDQWVDQLTGKAEEVAEKASDLLARAKSNLHSENTQVSAQGDLKKSEPIANGAHFHE